MMEQDLLGMMETIQGNPSALKITINGRTNKMSYDC